MVHGGIVAVDFDKCPITVRPKESSQADCMPGGKSLRGMRVQGVSGFIRQSNFARAGCRVSVSINANLSFANLVMYHLSFILMNYHEAEPAIK